MNYDLPSLLETANALADAARGPALQYFRLDGLKAENKETDHFDPVTEGDKAVERAIRERLAQLRPDDGVFGEEFGATAGTSGIKWIIDPIDGTRAYLCGAPTWGVLIAAVFEGRVICGVIDQPYTEERFIGGSDLATLLQREGVEKPLRTRRETDLAKCRLMTTFPEVGREMDRQGFQAVAKHVQLVRYGLDCYAYGLLAAGQIDLVIEAGLASYDIAGPIGVVEGAGGIVTTWSGGNPVDGGQVVAAANAELHKEVLALLAPFAG